jgi:hypothetical protein
MKMRSEVLVGFGKVRFVGDRFNPKDLPKQTVTIEVRSNLKALNSYGWGWPTNPQRDFADHLDGQPEGTYRVFGKRRDQNICREYLCDLILGTELRNIWFFPQEYQDSPLFELFYCSTSQWLGPKTNQKLLNDVCALTSEVDENLEYLRNIFAIGADSGFIYVSSDP